jgi:hypothetical protein
MRQVIAAVVVLASASFARADGAIVVNGQLTDGTRVFAVATPNDGGFVKIGRDVYPVGLAFVNQEFGFTYFQFTAPDGTFLPGTYFVVSQDGRLYGRITDPTGQLIHTLDGTAVVH